MSVLVCGIVGPIIGCLVLGLITGNPRLAIMVDIAGVPVIAYALISMAPPGAVAGILASGIASALIRRGYATGAHRRSAPLLGMALGGGAGFVLGLALRLDPRSADNGTRLYAVAGITGTVCGSLIAAWVLWVTRPVGDKHVPA